MQEPKMEWYYYNEDGKKIGPIDVSTLKELAKCGVIKHETIIENANGRTSKAGNVRGLGFQPTVSATPVKEPSTLADLPSKQTFALPTINTTTDNFHIRQIKTFLKTSKFLEKHWVTVIVAINGIALSLYIIIFSITGTIDNSKPSGLNNNSSYSTPSYYSSSSTLSSFNQIQMGMDYDKVVAIVGRPTETSIVSEFAEIRITMYSWHVNDSLGANFNVTFQNGKVIAKAQFGLR